MTQDPTPDADRAGTAKGGPRYPLRPDGWPDWLGRRPMSNGDRANLTTSPTPARATQLRGRIHAAARAAAEGRQTTCYSTHSTITIGIRGPDAQERVDQLRHALDKLIAKHDWTTRNEPR
jgi:hypothetical protein